MDFAIIEANGKQYKITDSCEIEIEHLEGELAKKVTFDRVLMLVDGEKIEIGTPYIEGKSFEAEIAEQKKGKKIKILRFRAKSRHRRKVGFRPQVTKLAFGVKEEPKKEEKQVKTSLAKVNKKEVKTDKKVSTKTPAKASSKKVTKKVVK